MQFIYLIISLYFGRKNPLYFLIFPIALVSGPGAFIDPRTVMIADDVFIIGKNIYKDVIIIYLILVVWYLSRRCNYKLVSKTPMGLYGLYILILVFITFAQSGTDFQPINIMRLFTHMILGYFLLLLIFSTASTKQFISFFNMLFVATGILSICYVTNSANVIPFFYQKTLYQKIDIGNVSFYRDFGTIPYFSHLLFILAYSLVLTKSNIFNRKAVIFVLVTYPFVLLYTFTRSILITAVIECVIINVILFIKSPRSIFKLSIIFLVVIVMINILQSAFHDEYFYFSKRMGSAASKGRYEGNVITRIAYHLKANEILKKNNAILFGDGLNKKHEPMMDAIGAWTADSTIPFFLVYTGYVGVIFYYFIGWRILRRIIYRLKKYFNPLSVALFAFILVSLLSSLLNGGYRWGDPFIFFPYVLVIIVENLFNNTSSIENTGMIKELE